LIALAKSLGVESKITFASTPDVGLYYSAADMYVSASLTESFGLANLEALSHKLPCVCTCVGGVPEVVQDAALLVKPQASALLNGLRSLMMDKAQNDALIKSAHALMARWPNLLQITQAYVQVYQSNP
jgi:glycosyltransferase involved in cell wall biosynthesis